MRESLSEGELSFQDLVSDINIGQKQKDVTFAFYFISLLHLANEKVRNISIDIIKCFYFCLEGKFLHFYSPYSFFHYLIELF